MEGLRDRSDGGIQPGLATLGIAESDLAAMAAAAAGITRLTSNNPQPVDADALLCVLRGALHGTAGGSADAGWSSVNRTREGDRS